MTKTKKLIFNGVWKEHGFTLGFHYQWWNTGIEDKYKEIRLYFLSWEFNFSILNQKHVKHVLKQRYGY